MTNIPPSRSPSPAAQRMRLYRERRRQRLRYISIPLHVTDIDGLIRIGRLKEDQREDVDALRAAVLTLVYWAVEGC